MSAEPYEPFVPTITLDAVAKANVQEMYRALGRLNGLLDRVQEALRNTDLRPTDRLLSINDSVSSLHSNLDKLWEALEDMPWAGDDGFNEAWDAGEALTAPRPR